MQSPCHPALSLYRRGCQPFEPKREGPKCRLRANEFRTMVGLCPTPRLAIDTTSSPALKSCRLIGDQHR
ncbi:hypothetical protein AWB68_08112 [Caballeronia choica]|uniref:Uncharacterized protein n=1 Tax=Caballeronia choica TaxID=326476 RepID=A0A158KZZ3_9BURK|nr:hypothetical protein AWB68_08112 [Caballeronia choica]